MLDGAEKYCGSYKIIEDSSVNMDVKRKISSKLLYSFAALLFYYISNNGWSCFIKKPTIVIGRMILYPSKLLSSAHCIRDALPI